MSTITVRSPADFHVHLRQGSLCKLTTPHVKQGGFDLAYVMPNLKPPVTTVDQAVAYKAELQAIDPSVEYLMTLYLSPELTPEEIKKAKAVGITGVKSYPRGVTTNSDGGIESYEAYYPVFAEMEKQDMVLNLHGEVPSDPDSDTHVLNAEARFLPHLLKIHAQFPNLRIVLEHATTRAAVEAVKACGPTVAATITAHHLALVVDDWAGQSWNFCKPVAKFPSDRSALREVIKEGHPRFFLGSDSAPHPPHAKSVSTPDHGCAAGIYTSPILLPLTAHLLDSFGALDKLEGFVSTFGRKFYKRELAPGGQTSSAGGQTSSAGGQTSSAGKQPSSAGKQPSTVTLRKVPEGVTVQKEYTLAEDSLVPFWAGKKIGWEIVRD